MSTEPPLVSRLIRPEYYWTDESDLIYIRERKDSNQFCFLSAQNATKDDCMKKFTVCLKALPILLLSTSALASFGDFREGYRYDCRYWVGKDGWRAHSCDWVPVSTSNSKDDNGSSTSTSVDRGQSSHKRSGYGYGGYRGY